MNWGGHTEEYEDVTGKFRVRWVPQRVLQGVSYDTPVQGYGVNNCNTLTLWSARALESFALDAFNTGDFYKAVERRSSPRPCPRCCTQTTNRKRESG